MRRYTCALVTTLTVLLAIGESAFAQQGGCIVFGNLENRNRSVYAPPLINAECVWPHSVPYGNWGVNSNHGSRQDGDQYQGFFPSDGHEEWNSCFDHTPYTLQNTNQGNNDYGSFIVGWAGPGVPCYAMNLEGFVVTSTGNYMKLYELDPFDLDEWVATLSYPNVSATLTLSGGNWTGQSNWVWSTHRNPDVSDAQIRLYITSGWCFWC